MNGYDNETDLRKLFESRRIVTDDAELPPFRRLWNAAQDRESVLRSARKRRRIVLAAAALLVLASSLYLYLRPAPGPSPEQLSASLKALNEWKASTDFLLETPGSTALLTNYPDFRPSVTATDFQMSEKKKLTEEQSR